VKQYENIKILNEIFQKDSFLDKYPYFLPNIILTIYSLFCLVLSFIYLNESNLKILNKNENLNIEINNDQSLKIEKIVINNNLNDDEIYNNENLLIKNNFIHKIKLILKNNEILNSPYPILYIFIFCLLGITQVFFHF
jgi:hypothetical protein